MKQAQHATLTSYDPSTVTGRLVEQCRALHFDALPGQAVDLAGHVVMDGVAVMLAGSTEPLGLGRRMLAYVADEQARPAATIAGSQLRTSPALAAFVNGTYAHALDFDNTWYPLNHPTSPTLPAILAIGEDQGASGRDVIAALVAAFEVQGRLRLAATGLHTGRGFHKPGTTGTFGAVTAAAAMLDLEPEAWCHALGIAGSRAGSLAINTGSMTKATHSGHAARMGVESAQLAELGMTASPDVFGPGGFLDAFLGDDHDVDALLDHFADPLRMVESGVGFKKHPANYFTHRVIDAVLALRREHGITGSDVDRVRILFPDFRYVDRPAPVTGLDGKFSVQYTAALALLDGRITIDSFTDERRFAADVEDVLSRTEVTFDPSIPDDFLDMHVRVALELSDGRIVAHRVDELTGMPGVPLTREQRLEKFHLCAERVLDRNRAEELAGLLERLTELDDIRELVALLRAGD